MVYFMDNIFSKKRIKKNESKVIQGGNNKMFKHKTKKAEVKEETVEPVEEPEEEIEDEVPEENKPTEETEEEVVEEEEKPDEQKINLTPEEVISIVEFNLQRAIQSLQLLK